MNRNVKNMMAFMIVLAPAFSATAGFWEIFDSNAEKICKNVNELRGCLIQVKPSYHYVPDCGEKSINDFCGGEHYDLGQIADDVEAHSECVKAKGFCSSELASYDELKKISADCLSKSPYLKSIYDSDHPCMYLLFTPAKGFGAQENQ